MNTETLSQWSKLSDAEVLSIAPACGHFSRDELESFCAGFRRCAGMLSGSTEPDGEDAAKWSRINIEKLGGKVEL